MENACSVNSLHAVLIVCCECFPKNPEAEADRRGRLVSAPAQMPTKTDSDSTLSSP